MIRESSPFYSGGNSKLQLDLLFFPWRALLLTFAPVRALLSTYFRLQDDGGSGVVFFDLAAGRSLRR